MLIWDLVVRGLVARRYAPMGGIIGFDWPSALAVAPIAGVSPRALLDYLPALEQGMLLAFHGGDDDVDAAAMPGEA